MIFIRDSILEHLQHAQGLEADGIMADRFVRPVFFFVPGQGGLQEFLRHAQVFRELVPAGHAGAMGLHDFCERHQLFVRPKAGFALLLAVIGAA